MRAYLHGQGKRRKRPELDKCLKRLNAGEVLVVWKIGRLGRSLRDLITLLDDLKGQGVKFKSLTESIDAQTPTGRAMWQMVGVLAELKRSLIQEQTKAGWEAAKRRRVKPGRKPKPSPQRSLTHGNSSKTVKAPRRWRNCFGWRALRCMRC
jgi:Enterobacteriaceae phage serine recombinase